MSKQLYSGPRFSAVKNTYGNPKAELDIKKRMKDISLSFWRADFQFYSNNLRPNKNYHSNNSGLESS